MNNHLRKRLDQWVLALWLAFGEPRKGRAFGAKSVLSRIDRMGGALQRRGRAEVDAMIAAAFKGVDLSGLSPDEWAVQHHAILKKVDDQSWSPEAIEDAIREALRPFFALDQRDGVSLRHEIAMMVKIGFMTPAEEEAWAHRMGWPAFAAWADPARFDPRRTYHWSLAQAACWIASHIARQGLRGGIPRRLEPDAIFERISSLDPVRQRKSVEWVKFGNGYELRPREDRGFKEPEDGKTEAKLILLQALRAGFVGFSIGERNGLTVEIDPGEWTCMKIVGFQGDDGVLSVAWEDADGGDPPPYTKVRLVRDNILSLWPL